MLDKSQKKFIFLESKGMTFLELVVVMGIFAAIAATVLFNHRDFSTNVALQNLSQEVALQLKRAQTDAVSGKTPTLSDAQEANINNLLSLDWTPSYGIAFNSDLHPGEFFYYFNRDDAGNDFLDFYDLETGSYSLGDCEVSGDSECLEEIYLPGNVVIDLICFDFDQIISGGTCADSGGVEADSAYISFTRPRGNASIMEFDDGSGSYAGNVFIRLSTAFGGQRFVTVWESGYISIK
jgi:type II secretory pathway pseudopilin PulG